MAKFKAKVRLPFASDKQMKAFVQKLIVLWEKNERSMEEVHDLCVTLLADAASGKEILPGKALYAVALGAELKALGCFMEGNEEEDEETSPYA